MLTSIALGLSALVCYCVYKTKGILWGRDRKQDEPPVVPGHLLWGNGKEFDDDSTAFILDCQKKHGSVFSIRMLYYYTTVIADPHSFESFSKERSFDFDPIQEQVNGNIFGFQIPESRNMIKFIGKTTRGSAVPRNLYNFSLLLDDSYTKLDTSINTEDWVSDSLDRLANKTLFQTIFNSIFGADKESEQFNYKIFHDQFKIFHKYFSYLWLGLPHFLFPEATKAVGRLFSQPTVEEFMASSHTSEYLKSAIEYLQSHNLTDTEIKCHNLVFMHININTFKISYWCMYKLMEHKEAMAAVRAEIERLIQVKKEVQRDDKHVTINSKDIEGLENLDSLVNECFRMASGVFMIRHNQQDVKFTVSATGEEYRIRAGDKVMMYPPAIHKDPEIYANPNEFKFNRFVNQKFYKSGKLLKNPVLPFGSLCPGRKIALLQSKWYIVSMLHRFDMELLPGEKCKFDFTFPGHEIVPPTNDVSLRYKSRHPTTQLSVQPQC